MYNPRPIVVIAKTTRKINDILMFPTRVQNCGHLVGIAQTDIQGKELEKLGQCIPLIDLRSPFVSTRIAKSLLEKSHTNIQSGVIIEQLSLWVSFGRQKIDPELERVWKPFFTSSLFSLHRIDINE
jgi:hypothetical protein